MSFFAFQNRKVQANAIELNPARLGPDVTRRAAMAFAIGEYRPSTDPPARRSTRANLPDVDWSRVVPVQQPSRLQRLARFLGLGYRQPQPDSDEWRVLRPMSELDSAVRHEDNVVPINHAA